MNLFAELKHRNVFRVAIAYVVVGWVLVQIADILVDSFGAPDWVMKVFIAFLVLGMPIALILAWAFELTPDGVMRAKDLPADMPKDPRSGRILNRITIITLVIAVTWLGWDKLQRPDLQPAGDVAAGVADKSIAVLPFADFSPGSDHAWFADGLTDEILNALARTRDLRVASRTSSFAYRNSELDATAIAAELEVAHILEGSVRRSGDRIRITAQLIRAVDDAHLWSETFDASSEDSIDIQERIAFEIASLLDTAMDPEELRRMVAAGTESIAAWEAFVQLQELSFRITENTAFSASPEQLRLYQEVVKHDPDFAEAHLLLATTVFDWMSPSNMAAPPVELSASEVQELFADASTKAMRHARSEDARLGAEILRARAQLRIDDVVRLTRARLEFNPYNREIWSDHLAALVAVSRFDEAKAFVQEVQNHDFVNNDGLTALVQMIARVDLDAGLAAAQQMLERPSLAPGDYYQIHRILLYDDRIEEAADIGQRYIDSTHDATWALMVKIRQACAEGRVADAERLYEDYDFSRFAVENNNMQWLALKTLGRDDEARELLRPLDRPELLGRLMQLLTYTHFDPAHYPQLTQHLEGLGVMRQEVTPINFACKR